MRVFPLAPIHDVYSANIHKIQKHSRAPLQEKVIKYWASFPVTLTTAYTSLHVNYVANNMLGKPSTPDSGSTTIDPLSKPNGSLNL
jgi:hypothetical protein